MNAGAPQEWRSAVLALRAASKAAMVSGLWLVLFYFFATVAELCVSPVGLSLVTKLAPARYGSLFMGVWLLTNSVAQYVGGAVGESWGSVTPTSYFMLFVWVSILGAVALLTLVRPVKRLMHEVR